MFDSGITAAELIADLQEEADIAIDIPNKLYVEWLNSLEQLLYSEIIREQRFLNCSILPTSGEEEYITELNPSELTVSDEEDAIRFEDVYAVFINGVQLIKSTLKGAAGDGFPNVYYKSGDNIITRSGSTGDMLLVYIARPALKSADNEDNVSGGNVMVPAEFIDLVKAKLRGEAYKLANEDVLAAKWLNDYNTLLETFKAWIMDKRPQFGQ